MRTLPKNTYTYQVKQWLESGRSITSKQAIDEFGCTRLAAVISRLKNLHGMNITSTMIPVKNRHNRWVEVAKYMLVEDGLC
jgi:vacuolar-type H+-ATPase subunit I/STV1